MRLDLIHLARTLRRSPAGAAAAILTLALAIGAAASIFAVVDDVLLTRPPFADPSALVTLGETLVTEPASAARPVGYATFEAWRERAQPFAALEAFDATNLTLTGFGAAERVSATDVTVGFFGVLGVEVARGRTFVRDDEGQPVAVISHDFWRAKLAGDPAVIGRQIVLGGQTHTIVGVLPEPFCFALNVSDVWRPLPSMTTPSVLANARVHPIGRLAAGSSAVQLARALDERSAGASLPLGAVAIPIATAIAGESTRTLGLLSGAAALALVIAFINLAGLLLVRSLDRRRELAVRSALGAPPSEIARQLMLEAIAIVALGTMAGIVLAAWTTPLARTIALEQFGAAASRNLTLSWRVIGGVSIAALASALLAGVFPAISATRCNVVDGLRRGTTASPSHVALRRMFVSGEVALAFVLLVSMALLGRTLISLLRVSPGFTARGVLTMHVALPASYTTNERVASFYTALQEALRARLGEGTASIVDELPLTGDKGRTLVGDRSGNAGHEAVLRTAGPGYFHVLRIPIVAGRSFESSDNGEAPTRVVISASLAERLFPAQPPVGQPLLMAGGPVEIVGVAGDVKHRTMEEPALPTIYLAAAQSPSRSSLIVVRSERPDSDVTAAVREEVARLDDSLPVYGVRSMEALVASSPGVPARRLLTVTFFSFSLLAVVLSAVGLFGVAAHDVASRRQEFALRIALGADPFRILKTTMARGATMLGSGLGVGAVLSIWTARGLSVAGLASTRFDFLSTLVAVAVLAAAGTAALLPPALRAAHTDPLMALRDP